MDIATFQESSPFAIRFEDVTCRIGKRTVLDGIQLDIKRGEITGLLGPNGAGKTTLLNLILGLRVPVAGKVRVLGRQVSGRNTELFRRIGVVLQETALYDELTAFENLYFAASLYGIANPRSRIEEVLQLLDLADRAGERAGHLSGGLRRRLLIARALLHHPELLIIDEPTLGVDVEARHSIWSHLRVLRSVGTTVFVSTNYLDEVIALCDTVAILRAGKLILSDTPEALVARAGSCLDIECASSAVKSLEAALLGANGVLRIRPTSTGLSVFLQGNTLPDPILRTALQTATIRGFRMRGADLAEVFQALETPA
jgi:ABC-2 type transport system ATP-binding protein